MKDMAWKLDRVRQLQVRESGEVVYFAFPALEDTGIVKHGFTTRKGGVSKGIYSTMNLSFTRGDEAEAVHTNFHRAAEAIGFAYENIVCSDQTHTANVRVVTGRDRGKGVIKPKDYAGVDGMVTNVPGLALATFYADCVPLYFVDPVKKAIGLSHSGWKGTVGRIGNVTVKTMIENFGTNPADLLAGVGPSICQDCYEVSEEVAEAFRTVFDISNHDEILKDKGKGKYQLDLWRANQLILLKSGIAEENISMPGLCTCCNPEILFSHRASKGRRGNLAAFLALQ